MAVTPPVRALLAAHLQATWNRSRRELGTFGRVVQILFLCLVACLGLVPLVVVPAVGGYLLGARLPEPGAARILGSILGLLALMGGVVGGIAGGSRVLAWEAARVFPLRLRSLFTAELVAGLGDLLPLCVTAATTCLLLGLGAARPRLALLLPLPWLGTVLGLLCIQYLVNSLAAKVVQRLQVGLMLLFLCAWAGLSMPGLLTARLASWALAAQAFVQRLALATPPLQCLEGLRAAVQGDWGWALARQLYPVAALGLLVLAAARTLEREADPSTLRTPAKGGRARTWTFTTPVRGLARLHWHTLITSHLGKFGFLIPLMVLVVLRGPHLSKAPLWSVPGGFSYLALSGVQLQLNQFGLDGPGVKTLLLLPLRARDILAGKALGLLAYMGAQTVLLLAIMGASGRLPAVQVLPALCLSGCLFLYQVGLGHWTSAWLPRPMPRDSLKNHNVAPAVIWLGMAATLLGAVVFGGTYLLLAWLRPMLLLPVLAGLLGGMVLLYLYVLLPAAAVYLDQRREVLVHALGRPG